MFGSQFSLDHGVFLSSSYGIVYGQTRTRMDPYPRRVGVVPGSQAGDGGGVSDVGAKTESMDHIL